MTDLDLFVVEPISLLAGLIIGSVAGLILGWLVWYRSHNHGDAMQDL